MSKTLVGNEFSFCNNTETLFPGIKILLHHNLAPDFGCNSPVSWKYSMFQCLVVHFLSSDFLKLPESKCTFYIISKTSHTTFQMSKRNIRTSFRINGHYIEWFVIHCNCKAADLSSCSQLTLHMVNTCMLQHSLSISLLLAHFLLVCRPL